MSNLEDGGSVSNQTNKTFIIYIDIYLFIYDQRFKRGGAGGIQGNNDNPGETDVDVRMLVHQSQAGCIIGKGGLKVKELREVSSKCNMCVFMYVHYGRIYLQI